MYESEGADDICSKRHRDYAMAHECSHRLLATLGSPPGKVERSGLLSLQFLERARPNPASGCSGSSASMACTSAEFGSHLQVRA